MDLDKLAEVLEDANSLSHESASVLIEEYNQALLHYGLIIDYDYAVGEWAVYVS